MFTVGTEALSGIGETANSLDEGSEGCGILGITHVEAIGECSRHGAGCCNVASGFGDCELSTLEGIEVTVVWDAICCECDAEGGTRKWANDSCICFAWAEDGVPLDFLVVAAVDG